MLARSGGLAARSACDVVLFVRRETTAALSPGQELLQNFSQKIGPFAAVLDGLPDSRWFVEERAIGLQLCCMADLSDWDGRGLGLGLGLGREVTVASSRRPNRAS